MPKVSELQSTAQIAQGDLVYVVADGVSSKFAWQDESLQPSVMFPNAIWTWWQPNLAVHRNDVTYLCYSDDAGRSYIASYDHETGVVNQAFLKQYTPDDHHAGAIVVTDTQPVVVFTHGRGLDAFNRIYYRRSVNPGQITGFDDEEYFSFTNPSQQTDYPTASVSGSEILVMCRLGLDKWCARYTAWPLTETPDWGSEDADNNTWFYDATIDRPYVLPRQDRSDPDIIHLAIGTLPAVTTDKEDVRYGYIEVSTGGIFTAAGVEIGNLKTRANLPLAMSAFTSVYAAPSGTKTRVYDISSDGQAILFSTYTGTAPGSISASNYQYARRQVDNTWTVHEVVATGDAILSNYFGGGAFDYDDSRLFYLCRNSGSNWLLESVVSNAEASFTQTLVQQSTDILMRPITVIDAGDEIRYLWQRLRYYNDFEEFYSDGWSPITDRQRNRAFSSGSLISIGKSALQLSDNQTLGSPQDLRPTSIQTFDDTEVAYMDIDLDPGWREMEIFIQGPVFASGGSNRELRARLLDAGGSPITGSIYYYTGTQTVSRTPAHNVIGQEGVDHFLLARGNSEDSNLRPRGSIRVYTYSSTSTMRVIIQSEITSTYPDTGTVIVRNCFHGVADDPTGTFASGLRLYADSGNIRTLTAMKIGKSSVADSIL